MFQVITLWIRYHWSKYPITHIKSVYIKELLVESQTEYGVWNLATFWFFLQIEKSSQFIGLCIVDSMKALQDQLCPDAPQSNWAGKYTIGTKIRYTNFEADRP